MLNRKGRPITLTDTLFELGYEHRTWGKGHGRHEVLKIGPELNAQIGETVIWEDGETGEVEIVAIEFTLRAELYEDEQFVVTNRAECNEVVQRVKREAIEKKMRWTYRYGFKTKDGLRYLYDHEIVEGNRVVFTGRAHEVWDWLRGTGKLED